MAWVGILGGLGLFLLGMAFLTDSLQAALGSKIKKILQRLTANRLAAFGTGAAVTAVIQSSSATSLITLSLVGAGIISLSGAIAVLIGANVGTTATAYLVSLVGLKFSVSTVALPLVGVGGLARVFLRGPKRIVADLLLGFGLLFVGIDFMQAAMADVAANIDLSTWAATGFFAGLMLVLIGIALTALMQSSSAAMAVTLAALASGAIDIRMGALLVIGQNVGTTVTAMLGAIGASTDSKRAAGAHLVFNLGTAMVALALLPVLLRVAQTVAEADSAFALAVFHTVFNLVGAVIFLPLTVVLARGLQRVIPSEGDSLTTHLDRSSLRVVAAAKEAIRRTFGTLILEQMRLIAARSSKKGPGRDHAARMRRLKEALDATEDYMEAARGGGSETEWVGDAMRALDHLRNITIDLDEQAPLQRFHLDGPGHAFLEAFRSVEALIPAALSGASTVDSAVDGLKKLATKRKEIRREILRATAQPGSAVQTARMDLEAIHWLDRIAWHLRHSLLAWGELDEGGARVGPANPS